MSDWDKGISIIADLDGNEEQYMNVEMENEMLRNSIKYGNTAFESKQDNSIFWLAIIILVGVVVFLGLQLNEQHQTFKFINELFSLKP